MTFCFCFPDLKNQGDIDETGTQLSLAMVIVLCVASLVAVALICGTVVVVVMYKRWSPKHEARTSEKSYHQRLEPRNLRSLKYKQKENFLHLVCTNPFLGRFVRRGKTAHIFTLVH